MAAAKLRAHHKRLLVLAVVGWWLCREELLRERLPDGSVNDQIVRIQALQAYDDDCECRVRMKDRLESGDGWWGLPNRLGLWRDETKPVRLVCRPWTGDDPCGRKNLKAN